MGVGHLIDTSWRNGQSKGYESFVKRSQGNREYDRLWAKEDRKKSNGTLEEFRKLVAHMEKQL